MSAASVSVDISPVAQVARHAHLHGRRVAIVYEGREVDYAELYELAGRMAGALREAGVVDGDRVAYLGANSLTFIIVYLASAWTGAAFVPINFRLSGPEVVDVLGDADPTVLIAEPRHAALVEAEGDRVTVPNLIVIDDDPAAGDPAGLATRWTDLSDFVVTEGGRTPVPVPRHEPDVAALLYTSGTTGRSKGVVLTHGNLWWNTVNMDSYIETRFEDVFLAVAPLFHIGTLNTFTLGAMLRGSTTVIRRSFDPAATLEDLVTLHVNGLFAVPAMFAAIARVPEFDAADLGALRLAVAAGAPVPPALISRYAEKGVLMQQAWGLTETAPCSTYLEASECSRKLGSAGVPMPYGRVRVADLQTGEPVARPGDLGELWVQGPNVAAGYWRNPEATAAAFTADGWFRSGDIGYADDEGFYYVVDRLKDMVISGGENVYPAEVERVLAAHPLITDAAVVGEPDAEWGEAVVAVVIPVMGACPTLDEVREFCSLELARYKLPRRLAVVETLPRNGSGKLDKRALRALLADHVERSA